MTIFNFRQKLNLIKNTVLKKPVYVQYYITARCNLACEQCNIIYADAKHEEMSLQQINLMADNMKKIGVSIVLLIGGEPFVRKDIHEIVRIFKKRNIHVRLQTNGLASEEQLKKCIHEGANDISVSLDTLNSTVQDSINGGFKNSWEKAIKTIIKINNIFPKKSTLFFNSVIMPKNFNDIENVIKFAHEIGWGISLVPIHTSSPADPMPYRTLDYSNKLSFSNTPASEIRKLISKLLLLKKKYGLYDSIEYINDIENFIQKKPIKWRRKNNNVCDSPDLYFAIAPSGIMKVCCDKEMANDYYVYDKNFPKLFENGKIKNEAYIIAKNCEGCLYGSYPEITLVARFLSSFIDKLVYFNFKNFKRRTLNEKRVKEIIKNILNEQN